MFGISNFSLGKLLNISLFPHISHLLWDCVHLALLPQGPEGSHGTNLIFGPQIANGRRESVLSFFPLTSSTLLPQEAQSPSYFFGVIVKQSQDSVSP